MQFFIRIFLFLPGNISVWALKCTADVHYFLDAYVLKGKREKLVRNINFLFPGIKPNEMEKIIKKYYRHFSDTRIEPFIFNRVTVNDIEKYVKYKNPELLQKLYSCNRNVLLLLNHYANWEYGITMPLLSEYNLFTTFRRMKNKALFLALKHSRERFGATLVDKSIYYRTVLKTQHANSSIYGLLADVKPRQGFKDMVRFFNNYRPIPSGPAKIAMKTNSVVVVAHVRKLKRFSYEYEFEILTDDPTAESGFMQSYFSGLESKIRSQPELWIALGRYDWSAPQNGVYK